jgi:hypothetical protein
MRLDELIDLLPEARLTLWRFDQGSTGWHVVLEGENDRHELTHPSGDGDTPLVAFIAAYRAAGFNVEDDGT